MKNLVPDRQTASCVNPIVQYMQCNKHCCIVAYIISLPLIAHTKPCNCLQHLFHTCKFHFALLLLVGMSCSVNLHLWMQGFAWANRCTQHQLDFAVLMPKAMGFRFEKKKPSHFIPLYSVLYRRWGKYNIWPVLKYFSRMNQLPQVSVGLYQVHRMAVLFKTVVPLYPVICSLW